MYTSNNFEARINIIACSACGENHAGLCYEKMLIPFQKDGLVYPNVFLCPKRGDLVFFREIEITETIKPFGTKTE